MRTRRVVLALVAVFALFGTACSGDGELGPSVGSGNALVVGDFSMTHDELAAEVDAWVADPSVASGLFGIADPGTPAARPMDLVVSVANLRLQTEQIAQMAEGDDLAPTAADLDAAEQTVRASFVGPDGDLVFDEAFIPYVTRVQYYFELGQQLVGAVEPPAVEVSSRYGTASETVGIWVLDPPAGSVLSPAELGIPGLPS